MPSFPTSRGTPLPLGSSATADGVNFALFSRHAVQVSLLLFQPGEAAKQSEIKLDTELNRTGDIWHIKIHDLPHDTRYGYRVTGPFDPTGSGHCFSADHLLLDPYARALTGGSDWGAHYVRRGPQTPESRFLRRSAIVTNDFDWEGDRPLNVPLKDSVIYELHVRGFTRHPSSGVKHPGTYAGIVEKIPYLKELGVTAVELMPVFEFNENENTFVDPQTGEPLKNFWGYSPLAFFAPKASFAVNGRNGNQVREFKEMVKALHQAGIEVILDVVFNHTAEGNANGPTYNFRGLDNTIYYLLDARTRQYLNFSGCGNTFNCNHPLVRHLILDCLRYWVIEMHVDGFRFDLASILGRSPTGEVLANPPMVEKIAEDPILARTKIIAEAWDAAGLYQVGSFSPHPRWAEWNGKFRDDVRAFLCSHDGTVPALATRIAGSSDLYQHSDRRPYNSINFITSHDGFTLHDLVSYNRKHNIRNGEGNRDGCNHEISWNSGVEGTTTNSNILHLRQRRIRTFATILMLSQGTPMLAAGDEFGRSQQGNNNAYCQDNEISWVDWRLAEQNHDLRRFFRLLIALRRRHAIFRRADFFPSPAPGEPPAIRWQSTRPGSEDWSPAARCLAFFLDGRYGGNGEQDDDFFIMLNGHRKPRTFTVPELPAERRWLLVIDTAAPSPGDISPEEKGKPLSGVKLTVAGLAAVVLISKPRP